MCDQAWFVFVRRRKTAEPCPHRLTSAGVCGVDCGSYRALERLLPRQSNAVRVVNHHCAMSTCVLPSLTRPPAFDILRIGIVRDDSLTYRLRRSGCRCGRACITVVIPVYDDELDGSRGQAFEPAAQLREHILFSVTWDNAHESTGRCAKRILHPGYLLAVRIDHRPTDFARFNAGIEALEVFEERSPCQKARSW